MRGTSSPDENHIFGEPFKMMTGVNLAGRAWQCGWDKGAPPYTATFQRPENPARMPLR